MLLVACLNLLILFVVYDVFWIFIFWRAKLSVTAEVAPSNSLSSQNNLGEIPLPYSVSVLVVFITLYHSICSWTSGFSALITSCCIISNRAGGVRKDVVGLEVQ